MGKNVVGNEQVAISKCACTGTRLANVNLSGHHAHPHSKLKSGPKIANDLDLLTQKIN